ncbi:hypothetical protein [Burkholderia mayonis]|uniref:hypothetical protein n=1 Tax=Burkholderia mayonis TaxID=1385591 RepID=UPI00131F1F30|nr:hypothetical protein [Burkholderia mayonis]
MLIVSIAEKKFWRFRHCKFLRDETVPFAFVPPKTEAGSQTLAPRRTALAARIAECRAC